MKPLTREQALKSQEERQRQWVKKYAETCETLMFLGLSQKEIASKLRIMGLGFDRTETQIVVSAIVDRMGGR